MTGNVLPVLGLVSSTGARDLDLALTLQVKQERPWTLGPFLHTRPWVLTRRSCGDFLADVPEARAGGRQANKPKPKRKGSGWAEIGTRLCA